MDPLATEEDVKLVRTMLSDDEIRQAERMARETSLDELEELVRKYSIREQRFAAYYIPGAVLTHACIILAVVASIPGDRTWLHIALMALSFSILIGVPACIRWQQPTAYKAALACRLRRRLDKARIGEPHAEH